MDPTAAFTVEKIMDRKPVAFPETATVLMVCEAMAEGRIGQVVVVDRGWRPRAKHELPPEPKGIFTERDLIRAFATHREDVLGKTVGELMTSPVVTVSPDDDIADAADLMMLMRIRRIPVVERGKTVGLLTRGKVMEAQSARMARLQHENEVLEDRVVHDPLTGLANRVLFDKILKREVLRAQSGGRAALLMLDLDFFKKVNDTRGHPVGDIVLRQLGDLLQEQTRRADLVARLGGEEFGVIVMGGDADPLPVAEKVRKAVEEHAFGEKGDPFHVTISIGAAAWGPGMKEPADLVKKADEALYEAKHGGRNKVVLKS